MPKIPLVDVRAQYAPLRREIEKRIASVLDSGVFILGPNVATFEEEAAAYLGVPQTVAVANGTDALVLVLDAMGIGPGDEVICPAFTFFATAEAIARRGATPVFADVDPVTLNLDPEDAAARITPRTRAIMPVHLFGRPAPLAELARLGPPLIEDAAQAFGSPGIGTSIASTFSFYPTKNLGALGDGGAVITADDALAARVRRLRNGGQRDRYNHVEAGVNSRLDELQAAVLRARLPLLPAWTARRRHLAAQYRHQLPAGVAPIRERDPGHVYHLFPIRVLHRDALSAHLAKAGIGTLVHYPVPLAAQQAFSRYEPAACPAAAAAAGELLSLPLHPRLSDADVARVAREVNAFVKGHAPA